MSAQPFELRRGGEPERGTGASGREAEANLSARYCSIWPMKYFQDKALEFGLAFRAGMISSSRSNPRSSKPRIGAITSNPGEGFCSFPAALRQAASILSRSCFPRAGAISSSISILLLSERSCAFSCVRLRSLSRSASRSAASNSAFLFSLQAFARSAAPSSRFGWRRSHPVNWSPLSVFPCIASRIAVTCSASISSAAATSSQSKFASVPLRSVAFAAFVSMNTNTESTSGMGRPERRAMTRHFGSVGISSQRRTHWLMADPFRCAACGRPRRAIWPRHTAPSRE